MRPLLIDPIKFLFCWCAALPLWSSEVSLEDAVISLPSGEDAMTGDTDKYLRPQDLKELGDDSLPHEGYMGFSIGARSAR